jgi:DNA (cytosine-5)-methyltransferase 1
MNGQQLPRAIDLFCGCGGMSVGIRAAGFRILAGVDIEPIYLQTYAHNFPDAEALRLDLSQLSPEAFMERVGIKPGELDMLAGGPPCQGFSKNVPRRERSIDAANNRLMKSFLSYCKALQPRLILMENVAEMKNGFGQAYTQELLQGLGAAGYAVNHAVLNGADYGVPQRRRRALFIASHDGIKLRFPTPTKGKRPDRPSPFDFPSHVTVWDAIGDLPSLEHGSGEEESSYNAVPISEFQRLMREGSTKLTNHVARKLQPTQFARLAALEPGQSLKDLPPELKVKGGYSGAYGRLTKDMVAPTITRWVFHPGSGRWGHPVDTRTLTIREAARIQSFPDSFEFTGSFVQQAAQVGNAVPPLLARSISECLRSQVSGAAESHSKSDSSEIFSESVGKENLIS